MPELKESRVEEKRPRIESLLFESIVSALGINSVIRFL
jgi:hypothetical protein